MPYKNLKKRRKYQRVYQKKWIKKNKSKRKLIMAKADRKRNKTIKRKTTKFWERISKLRKKK